MNRTLAIIPARGGSKGLPGKNIMSIAGAPLISWTIKTTRTNKLITASIVSTDDTEIRKVAEKEGGNVPFLRPAELSGDAATSADVALHCIDYYERQNIFFDNIVLLEPTSPLRKPDDIDNALRLFYSNYENTDGIVSLGKIHLENPAVVKYVANNHIFPISLNGSEEKVTRRQDYTDFYFPYGVLYIIKTAVIKEKKSFYTDKIMPYFIERWQNYELDDIYDFQAIEAIMKNKIKEGVL
jgi:CMP-N,N'-diacetyllegionaminic acid synthase